MVVASLVAVGGLWYTAIQTQQSNQQAREERKLSKEGQITDRYTAAVENLGDKKVDVRLGGVYALERIMQDSPRDHPTIANVLNTYVRTHADEGQRKAADKSREKGQHAPGGDEKSDEVPVDVHAALKVLVTRDTSHDRNFTINLKSAQLSNADLTAPKFDRWSDDSVGRPHDSNTGVAQLQDADLSGADLDSADLSEGELIGADLSDADLSDASLSDATLIAVNLRDADLRGADLDSTDRKYAAQQEAKT